MASLAIHTLVLFAKEPDRRWSTVELAERLHASPHTLSKTLQRLAKDGFVDSVAGSAGGFALCRPASEISLAEIYEAIDGPLGKGGCLLTSPICDGTTCVFGGLVEEIHENVSSYLRETTLALLAERIHLSHSNETKSPRSR